MEGDGLGEFVGGLWNVDIIEEDCCSLAAEFEFYRDQVLAALLGDHAAHLR